jgi:NAD(P)-dependent dehydrogenase (short-subunit alcohol dehydrogenase family)
MSPETAARSRTILVTGAASGIGAAVCRALAAPGVALLVHTRRNEAGAEAVAAEARSRGAIAETALGDLADPAMAARLVARAVTAFGGLDVLVSNAGFADRTPFVSLSDDAYAASQEAIAGAFFRLARAAVPYVCAGRDGRIVAVSSFVAHVFRTNAPTFPASAAAKSALEALVRALAIELAPAGVTVNAVVPGFIRKDAAARAALAPEALDAQLAVIPLGRIGLPDDVADAVRYLVSPAASYVTGQLLHVDGGLCIG